MPTISVLGLGNWGTALAHHLASKGNKVIGWSNEPEVVNSISSTSRNAKYLSSAELSANLEATGNLELALEKEIIVLAFPAVALSDVVPKLRVSESTIIVSAIKGLERTSKLTPLQYTEKFIHRQVPLSVLSGPSFAKDVVQRMPVGVVAAAKDEAVAKKVADLFASEWMRVYISTDPLGVELGGITKNVIAVAAGVCDGLGFGESARAGLITRGLAEMMKLAVAMGAEEKTLFGLSGLGDLAMTATSTTSRNHTVGYRMGKGEMLSDIIASLGSVAEGVATTPLILDLARKYGVEMPITEHVALLCEGKLSATDLAKSLVSRPTKREFS